MPILSPDSLEFISRSAEQTRRVGARLGARLEGGEVVALRGNLGAGKTVFAQGLGIGWGATTHLISPTFVLVHRHTRHRDDVFFYHIDLYRLETLLAVESLGLEDYLGEPDAVCVVEWPDRAPNIFPDEALWIELRRLDENRRSLTFRASGETHQALLDKFRKEIIGQ